MSYVYKKLSSGDFIYRMRQHTDHYSYDALIALFGLFCDEEEPTEFDPVAICGDWSEYTEEDMIEGNFPSDSVIELENGRYLVSDI